MSTVTRHYAHLLAPVYLWMLGGMDAALAQGAAEVAPFCEMSAPMRMAIDLGAGFGMHAIPLARRGYTVTAIDSSPQLLSILRQHGMGLAIRTVEADLLNFQEYLDEAPDLVMCMGDTLTHLQEKIQVETLFLQVAQSIKRGGNFVLGFRDYSNPPVGDARFIPVRSDTERILTCFLETSPTHIVVHDMLHEREDSGWRMHVSSYKKLRLPPEWVVKKLEQCGFDVVMNAAPRGMMRVIATR